MFVGWPAILHGKNFNVRHYTQTDQPSFSVLAMLMGTIDFYHFIPASQTLILPGGHKVSTKHKLLASFCPHFSSDQDEI